MIDLFDFYSFHHNVVQRTPTDKKRYLYETINFNQNAIMVHGFRGVGKTTLLVQYGKENYADIDEWLYLSADFYRVSDYTLYEIIDSYFRQKPGKLVVIDEIHKFANWKVQLKNILDAFKDKKIFITGSSSIELNRTHNKPSEINVDADLERRLSKYKLKHLSFREFLNFTDKCTMAPLTLVEILTSHQRISQQIIKKLESNQAVILDLFGDYLRFGSYPFFKETSSESDYHYRLNRLVSEIIESDIGIMLNLKMEKIIALKKLYSTIASSKPFKPNIEKLAAISELSRPTVYEYLHYLHMSGLAINLYQDIHKSMQITSKPEKICIANPNLIFSSKDQRIFKELIGSIRESFFVGNFEEKLVTTHDKADYKVGEHVFEIGGNNKTEEQIKGVEGSYLVVDGRDLSFDKKKIPLYLFGFLY